MPHEENAFHLATDVTMKVGNALELSTNDNGEFANDVHYTYIQVDEILDGISPYLVTEDFTMPDTSSFLDYSPYTIYEIYINMVTLKS